MQQLDKPGPATPEELRAARAVEILEQIGTPAARDVLARLAKGAPAAELTNQAQEALKRRNRAAGPMP